MIRRLRTFTLWTGTSLCVLIAALFVVSASWGIVIRLPGWVVFLLAGNAMFEVEMMSAPVFIERHSGGLSRWNNWAAGSQRVWLPLYALFAAVAIPTLLVCRFWPKPIKPGHCRCGYNLTGNQSGVCPECGVEVQA